MIETAVAIRRRLTIGGFVSVSMSLVTLTMLELLQRWWARGLVADPLADCEAPAARGGKPLSEAVPDGELRDVAPHRPGRSDAQRHAHVTAQPRPLVRIPRAAVIEERGHAHTEQAPNFIGDEHAILERQPRHVRAGELVDAEDPWPVLGDPEVELVTGLGAAQLGALDVQNQRLIAKVLARHGHGRRHTPRVGDSGRE